MQWFSKLISCGGPLVAPPPTDEDAEEPKAAAPLSVPPPACAEKLEELPAAAAPHVNIDVLIRSECPCALRPNAFFVAWNGVLTLVYTGFPPPLERLKRALNESAALGLKKENFGSKVHAPGPKRAPCVPTSCSQKK